MENRNNIYPNKKNDKVKRYFIFILILISIIQQLPIVKDIYYSQIRILLYLLFGLFVSISLLSFNKIISYRLVQLFSTVAIYNLFLYFITRDIVTLNVFEILIPFGILIISLNTRYTELQIERLLKLYVLMVVILSISSILYYGGSFTITQNYFLPSKNQIGPLIGIATIMTEVWIVKNNNIKWKYRVIAIIAFLLLISSVIVIRNRSSLVAILIISFILLSTKFKSKITIKSVILGQFAMIAIFIFLLFGVFEVIGDIIIKSFTLNYNVNDLNSLSAGRTEVYFQAFRFISEHPFLGELSGAQFNYSTPHNYILKYCVEFGVLGASIYIILYIYLWCITLKNLFLKKSKYLYGIPYWILFFSLLVSIFEYTYPYGPGVTQLMVWLLLGQQVYITKNETIN